jgi:hypothetical protein
VFRLEELMFGSDQEDKFQSKPGKGYDGKGSPEKGAHFPNREGVCRGGAQLSMLMSVWQSQQAKRAIREHAVSAHFAFKLTGAIQGCIELIPLC